MREKGTELCSDFFNSFRLAIVDHSHIENIFSRSRLVCSVSRVAYRIPSQDVVQLSRLRPRTPFFFLPILVRGGSYLFEILKKQILAIIMASSLIKLLQRKRYQYEVTFSLYMLTPTEKIIFSTRLPFFLYKKKHGISWKRPKEPKGTAAKRDHRRICAYRNHVVLTPNLSSSQIRSSSSFFPCLSSPRHYTSRTTFTRSPPGPGSTMLATKTCSMRRRCSMTQLYQSYDGLLRRSRRTVKEKGLDWFGDAANGREGHIFEAG